MISRNTKAKGALLAAATAALLLAGACEPRGEGPLQMDAAGQEEWEIRLVEGRIEKNEAFQDPARSPLPEDEIPGFEGLNYYFPDPSLVFRAELAAASGADTVLLDKRKGQQVPYVLKGHVDLLIEGRNARLRVYGPATREHGDYLWLPFSDPTNGEETYAGGRYLDLDRASDGTVLVDFNAAYNPLCDYDPQSYNCTLPPPENRLPIPIRAGEKLLRPGS